MSRKRNVSVEDFAEFLQEAFWEFYKRSIEQVALIEGLRPLTASDQAQYAKTLSREVTALLLFVFDFGMSAGPETSLRTRLRDAFIAAGPSFPPELVEIVDERAFEYKDAFMIPDPVRRGLALGRVFARHIGHDMDLEVAMAAATILNNILQIVMQYVNEAIPQLK